MAKVTRMPRGYGSRAKEVRPGTWMIQISAGVRADGARNRIAVCGKTREDVERQAKQLQAKQAVGEVPVSSVLTIRQLVDAYAKNHAELADSTWRRYEGVYRLYVLPALGAHKIRTLTAEELNRFFDASRAGPLMKGKERETPVMDSSVNNVKVAMGSLMQFAVTRGYATKNVVRSTDAIKVTSRDAYEMTDKEVLALLTACAQHSYGTLFETTLFQCLREAEAFGLRERDLDWTLNQLNICWQVRSEVGKGQVGKKPKWGSSRKGVPWMSAARAAVERRLEQRDAWRDEREKAKQSWSESDYIYTNVDGTPLYPQLAWRAFHDICERAKIPSRPEQGRHLTIGDLRHNGARIAMRRGATIQTIAKMLGHSRTTTSARYLGLKDFTPTAADVAGANAYFTEMQRRAQSA